ncbi:MAG: M20/M25/M40 family metallo-hydrolase, partial [bacterium]
MRRQRLLSIARELMSHPTAPFREHRVRQHIRAFAKDRGLTVRGDRMGNLVATTPGETGRQTLAFEAHMDHPGFLIEADSRRGRTTALFHGSVEERYFRGAGVRVFGEGREVTGRVRRTEFKPRKREKRAWLDVDGEVHRGDFAMWDLEPFRVDGDRLVTRACDDLVGCATILALIDELQRRGIERRVRCVFTAAEEGGLHGAKYLCSHHRLAKKTRVVAIETSMELPQA